ncbi:DUF6802 family protein [Skermania piniformis]|uniref:DUF6802 domain-containing protein n=1 Tax=Skermania pinensis TaxID=39122 RepID=A0ABX8S9V0_9ACTN|nr:DUF6802 family protein [Skermania piniformis]QXQ13759.1 hypothetical protein KV203_18555 [Skermania piniformis]
MIESDDLSTLGWTRFDLPDLDADRPLDDVGPIDIGEPTIDLDGDAVADTVTEATTTGLVVATDSDRDGLAEHVTIIDRTGEYAGWQYRHDECGGRWERTAGGTIGS